jgi:hypothetical protein
MSILEEVLLPETVTGAGDNKNQKNQMTHQVNLSNRSSSSLLYESLTRTVHDDSEGLMMKPGLVIIASLLLTALSALEPPFLEYSQIHLGKK